MKIKVISLFCLIALLLVGCSTDGEQKGVIPYSKEASEYMDKVAEFAQSIPDKAEKATKDEQAKEELKANLEEMKQEINEFGEIKAPEIADDFHREIVDKSKVLEKKIDVYLDQINKGDFEQDFVKKEDLSKLADEMKGSFEKIKDLVNKDN
ncbi:DUF6376 family protein [Bacillus sp. FJAT-27445]|uniref:DUF6376 family protein n=1 Tax=Bacillus sp. FJAT-27445 TaxID=1679166 RepID=UPI000743C30E|nr:DUF6376 family protein [Bacillus sp. FJAT-27445]